MAWNSGIDTKMDGGDSFVYTCTIDSVNLCCMTTYPHTHPTSTPHYRAHHLLAAVRAAQIPTRKLRNPSLTGDLIRTHPLNPSLTTMMDTVNSRVVPAG